MAYFDLIDGLVLKDFGVTSCVKNFSKKINWFFDIAAFIFLHCNSFFYFVNLLAVKLAYQFFEKYR